MTAALSLLRSLSRSELCHLERLVGDGYTPGSPGANEPDEWRACLRRIICGGCRHRGLRYRGLVRAKEGGGISYRVLGTCPQCGFCEEF